MVSLSMVNAATYMAALSKGENTWEDNIQLGLFWREGLAYSFAKIAGVLDEVEDLQKERGWKNG